VLDGTPALVDDIQVLVDDIQVLEDDILALEDDKQVLVCDKLYEFQIFLQELPRELALHSQMLGGRKPSPACKQV